MLIKGGFIAQAYERTKNVAGREWMYSKLQSVSNFFVDGGW